MINNLGYRASGISLPVIISDVYAILIFGVCIWIILYSLKHYSIMPGNLVYLGAFLCAALASKDISVYTIWL